MSKVGESLVRGAQEALAYAKGHKKRVKTHKINVPKQVNVRAIRDQLHMSRDEFAESFGFSIRTLEKWEQGIRQPKGPTRAYLTVIARKPEAVKMALNLNNHHEIKHRR